MAVLTAALAVAYPVWVYIGLTRYGARQVGLLIVALVVVVVPMRLWLAGNHKSVRAVITVPLVVVSLAVLSAVLENAMFVLMTPVMISAVLLAVFGFTLRSGHSPIIENFARLQQPVLSDAERKWCRTTTVIWCAFFLFNGLTALTLALWAPIEWWAAYAGGAAYVLMGALGAVELVARKWRFQTFGPGVIDQLLRRFLAREAVR